MDHLENKRSKPFINGDACTLDWMMLSTFNIKKIYLHSKITNYYFQGQ